MSVAVLEPTSGEHDRTGSTSSGQSIDQPSEWIDPEGDDWFAAIYRLLTQDAAPRVGRAFAPHEIEHWFG
jgi:hypothetical protein